MGFAHDNAGLLWSSVCWATCLWVKWGLRGGEKVEGGGEQCFKMVSCRTTTVGASLCRCRPIFIEWQAWVGFCWRFNGMETGCGVSVDGARVHGWPASTVPARRSGNQVASPSAEFPLRFRFSRWRRGSRFLPFILCSLLLDAFSEGVSFKKCRFLFPEKIAVGRTETRPSSTRSHLLVKCWKVLFKI